MITDNRFDNPEDLARQLARGVARRLQQCIDERGHASLAVSGGKTPVLFFQQLAQQSLAWNKVTLTQVDERWVDAQHSDSNARLIQQHLLQGPASDAFFLPLYNGAKDPEDGFMACENRLHELVDQLDLAVLGMGTDGHTASWFPGSSALPSLLDEQSGAWCCPVMGQEPARMSLTWSLLARCQHLYLHFEGDDKNHTFEQACEPDQQQDIEAMPVRTLLYQSQVPLSLYRSS